MAINFDNLVINRVIRGTLKSLSTGEVLCTVDQVENPSFECAGEQQFAVDNLGVRIAAFNRSKSVKMSAESSRIHLGLLAAQFGSVKTVASSGSKIVAPYFEIQTVGGAPNTTLTLDNIPYGTEGAEIPYIYLLNTDGSLSTTKFAIAATASATKFSLVAATKVLTLPVGAGLTATSRIAIWYDFESASAMKIENNADEFGLGGLFDLDVLLQDVCATGTTYHGHIIFGNTQLDPNFTINFTTEGKHPFSFEGMADYCDADKILCYIIICE